MNPVISFLKTKAEFLSEEWFDKSLQCFRTECNFEIDPTFVLYFNLSDNFETGSPETCYQLLFLKFCKQEQKKAYFYYLGKFTHIKSESFSEFEIGDRENVIISEPISLMWDWENNRFYSEGSKHFLYFSMRNPFSRKDLLKYNEEVSNSKLPGLLPLYTRTLSSERKTSLLAARMDSER